MYQMMLKDERHQFFKILRIIGQAPHQKLNMMDASCLKEIDMNIQNFERKEQPKVTI